MDQSQKPSFTYFTVLVLGQFPRFLLNYLDIDFEDKYIDKIEDSFRAQLKYGQVPYFVDNDGFSLTQTGPIIRYIASKYANADFLGKTLKDKAIVDETINAVLTDVVLQGYKVRKGVEDIKTLDTIIPRYFGSFEKSLASSTGKFICGDYVTLADLCVFIAFHYFIYLGHSESLTSYTHLHELKAHFESNAGIQKYITTRPVSEKGI
ncbi:hypothetical protein DICPUDRAFT_95080 [Dictyostelium purpureum]|uniref:Glutathione S-transferase n=1 Tax=Dictyostelium purpureum TaxID=5786 RepID=F0ZS16_DICPU|nr:uncharacterized protein DICPUDRAFT_95080 [Dictyostelium purpureum]EGC33258.1 hypothetical protein DICPUDRAFT_95080 [Dictyostelium purpureum]|eukprot:XP_003290205.1 hypothetical protein DICPUDRAFT_95080 [Dictyostelium purpureum]